MRCDKHMGSTCDCVFIAGDNIAIVGTGPYSIYRDITVALTAVDSPSVDLSVGGAGSVASPRTISGETAIGALLVLADDDVVMDVAGAGTTLDPLTVSAFLSCLACDDPRLANGKVPMVGVDHTYRPQVVPVIPAGAVTVGPGLIGDGSAGNPLRLDVCTYDELVAACPIPPPVTGVVDFIFPGVAGNHMGVFNDFTLTVTGDVEILLRVKPATWRPASNQVIFCRWLVATNGEVTTNNRSWKVTLWNSGSIGFDVSSDGIAAFGDVSGTAIPNDGAARWLRIRRTAATGQIVMEYAPDSDAIPTAWTALSNNINTAGPMYGGREGTIIGEEQTTTPRPYAGQVMRAILRNGIGGPSVLDIAETNTNLPGATSFTATSGQTVLVTQVPPVVIVKAEP